MEPRIRPLTDHDRQSWEGLFASYAAFYQIQVPTGGFDSVWGWIFDDHNDFWCDVAETDGQLIGFVQYQLMHRSLGGTMVCYLSDLYVEPTTRGSGLGRGLIDHVLDFAQTNGIPSVRWLTQESNYPARALYDTYTPKSDFILYSVHVESS
ncbi:MAG: GNAT family N-acetyltransferase [Acidimicrobiia bacterium]|nr:GNAT family N-acetyltransferase [Acidimicrobiia bacterium]MDH5503564.1 GNAT family N-acetyltransferase [Acidimicrobiia bacterium]